jgi:hypothetical protein
MELPEIVEREDARWLVEHDALDERLKRLYSTKGRVGKVTGLQRDAESLRWVGETKVKSLPKWLVVAYEQIFDLAKKQRKYPVLMLHVPGIRQGEHTMHVISREHHEELLGLLQQVAELQAEVDTLRLQVANQEPVVRCEMDQDTTRELKEYIRSLERVVKGLQSVVR